MFKEGAYYYQDTRGNLVIPCIYKNKIQYIDFISEHFMLSYNPAVKDSYLPNLLCINFVHKNYVHREILPHYAATFKFDGLCDPFFEDKVIIPVQSSNFNFKLFEKQLLETYGMKEILWNKKKYERTLREYEKAQTKLTKPQEIL